MNEDVTPPVAGTAAEAAPGHVIEIGWQVLLVPLVALAVVGGYWAGRQLNPAPPPAADAITGGDPFALNAQVVPADPNVPMVITLEPSQLQQLDPNLGFGNDPIPLPPANHPLMGQAAPDFKMKQLADGAEVSLADFHGKTVMINFWATWCPPCRLEMPWLESLYGNYKDKDFVLLAVDAGERVPPSMVEERVKQFVDRMALTFPVLIGDNTYDVQRIYSVYGLPSTFIVDPGGTVVDYHNGMYPNEATLRAQVEKVFGGESNAQ